MTLYGGKAHVPVQDLRQLGHLVSLLRGQVQSNSRMSREDKIAVFTRLKAMDALLAPMIQIGLFSPDQRE